MTHASILITAFHRVELLRESMESLWANTYYPHEIIIHDDGSNMATKALLMWLMEKGYASSVILNPVDRNRGQCLSADRAFAISTGDYIVKMEGDEQYTPGWLTKAVKAMELWPQIGQLSLQQFWHTHNRYTTRECLTYPRWDEFTLRTVEKEGVKIAVIWTSPGGQFVMRRQLWQETGPWYTGIAEQETIEWRSRAIPMFRLLPGWERYGLPAVKEDQKEAHWRKYKDTPWLAVLDPPVVSSAWGTGKSLCRAAKTTIVNKPKVFSKEGMPKYATVRGQFGSMRGFNRGRDLDRFGPK